MTTYWKKIPPPPKKHVTPGFAAVQQLNFLFLKLELMFRFSVQPGIDLGYHSYDINNTAQM